MAGPEFVIRFFFIFENIFVKSSSSNAINSIRVLFNQFSKLFVCSE